MKTDTNRKPYKGKRKRKFNQSTKDTKTQKFRDDYREYSSDEETNDPSWYAQYPELMQAAASIPYSIPTGSKIDWNVITPSIAPLVEKSGSLTTAYKSVPGIMTLGIVPTPGISTDAESAINIAAKLFYSNVRSENSGAKVYDWPDLMLYALAMDQIYSLITWYNRIYGTLMLYSQVNRYLPKALLNAQWIDFDDLIHHINDFYGFVALATSQAAMFAIPGDMKLFNRHAFMYQNYYKDAESPKSQLYMFAPRVFYSYDEMSGPGQLVAHDIVATYPNKLKYADLINLFYTLLNPIVASEDFNVMSGDVLKAYKETGILKLQLMPQNYTVFPIVDYEVLTQIKNATIGNLTNSIVASMASDPTNWSITQDPNTNVLLYNPYLYKSTVGQYQYYTKDRFLSTYKTTPEPADNMVYTRLMYMVKEFEDTSTTPTTYRLDFDSVGSEFVSGVNVEYFTEETTGEWVNKTAMINDIGDATPVFNIAFAVKLMLIKHFDFCPAIYVFGAGSGVSYFIPIFDLDNWTVVHASELKKMHDTALMSMLRIPMIGSAVPSTYKK